jgi:hypothetical protein
VITLRHSGWASLIRGNGSLAELWNREEAEDAGKELLSSGQVTRP